MSERTFQPGKKNHSKRWTKPALNRLPTDRHTARELKMETSAHPNQQEHRRLLSHSQPHKDRVLNGSLCTQYETRAPGVDALISLQRPSEILGLLPFVWMINNHTGSIHLKAIRVSRWCMLTQKPNTDHVARKETVSRLNQFVWWVWIVGYRICSLSGYCAAHSGVYQSGLCCYRFVVFVHERFRCRKAKTHWKQKQQGH